MLPERARIAEVARDAEASEICKRSCVLPEGLARTRRKLSLRGRLFISVWIAGRGMSESPWITGRSERARIAMWRQIGFGEACKKCAECWMVLNEKRPQE